MMYSYTEKKRIRKSFGKTSDVIQAPNLIDLQINKILRSGSYFLKISNLLDENYQKPHGYNQDKRTFNFGVKF